jgi:hypothetical protein
VNRWIYLVHNPRTTELLKFQTGTGNGAGKWRKSYRGCVPCPIFVPFPVPGDGNVPSGVHMRRIPLSSGMKFKRKPPILHVILRTEKPTHEILDWTWITPRVIGGWVSINGSDLVEKFAVFQDVNHSMCSTLMFGGMWDPSHRRVPRFQWVRII